MISLSRTLAPASATLVAVALATQVPAFAAFPRAAEGAHVAVATDDGQATHAALDVLREGGSAADAAVAAVLVLGVVAPSASGLGGGGFALVWDAKEKRAFALDFRETSPAGLVAGDVIRRVTHPQDPDTEQKRGISVGVPGEPAGLAELSRRWGRRSLADVVRPAALLAERGFSVGRHLADRLLDARGGFGVSPELTAMLTPGGVPAGYRTKVARQDLARTLTRFGAEGAKPFYEGDIAAAILRTARAVGSLLAPDDLVAYRVKDRPPLTRTVDGRTLVTVPAPSAGALMVHEVLGMYGASPRSSLRPMGFGSSAYLHTIAEAMRGAVADRARLAADPDVEPGVVDAYDRALEDGQLARRRARIEPNKTHAAPEFRTREGGTTHVAVADAEGNVVMITTTVNDPFGARIVAGDTGILLNDELDDFSTLQDVAGFGVIGFGPNRPRPTARPVSSMVPALVLEKGEPLLALGGSGGTRIATGVTQAALARLVFELDPAACVSAPRVHVTGSSAELIVDVDVTDDVRGGLRARGENVRDDRMTYAGVTMIAWEREGGVLKLLAAADPRKQGAAAAQ